MTAERPDPRPTILLTEDDPEMTEVLCFLLEREGYAVAVAEDGREAMRLVDEAAPPELALVDIMLPYVNGHQLVNAIRNSETWRDVPVIMLTAKHAEGDVVHALESGANDYVMKPFRPKELLARVRRLLEPKAG